MNNGRDNLEGMLVNESGEVPMLDVDCDEICGEVFGSMPVLDVHPEDLSADELKDIVCDIALMRLEDEFKERRVYSLGFFPSSKGFNFFYLDGFSKDLLSNLTYCSVDDINFYNPISYEYIPVEMVGRMCKFGFK